MKSDFPVKQFVVVAALAAVAYFGTFAFIENRRTRNGPWSVTFTTENSTAPTLVVNQPRLNIANLKIVFGNQKIAPTNSIIVFDPPKPVPFDVPFGACAFMDTTFQPGTVVLSLYGHEIQLMPRILTVDKKEIPWQSNFTVSITNAP